jgi:hypothetical protein
MPALMALIWPVASIIRALSIMPDSRGVAMEVTVPTVTKTNIISTIVIPRLDDDLVRPS